MWQALYAGLSHVRERSHGGRAEEWEWGRPQRPHVVLGLGAHHLVMNIFFLHVHGTDGIEFYTRKKMFITRW